MNSPIRKIHLWWAAFGFGALLFTMSMAGVVLGLALNYINNKYDAFLSHANYEQVRK